MRFEGRRKKKLVVAFHFHIAAPRGWDCDYCRKEHLEIKRRCGFVAEARLTEARPVWARRDVGTDSCPKSIISAQSLEWLEEFAAWRSGYMASEMLTARQIDAFQLLEEELMKEAHHAKQSIESNIPSRREKQFGK